MPSTRPGSPLPHAWLDDPDGNRLPIKDLVKAGRFLLIAGEEGDAWIEAANEIADAAGLPLDFLRIGHLDGDLYDPQLTWTRNRGIGADGAILVRPDRFVAWRAGSAAEDPKRVLAEALSSLLGREVSAPEEAAA